jgi:hypothetical protein
VHGSVEASVDPSAPRFAVLKVCSELKAGVVLWFVRLTCAFGICTCLKQPWIKRLLLYASKSKRLGTRQRASSECGGTRYLSLPLPRVRMSKFRVCLNNFLCLNGLHFPVLLALISK